LLRKRLALLLAVLALLIVADGATVGITKIGVASYAGFQDTAYFENQNAPVTGTPVTADTQTTQPTTSGSFTLGAGATMYLWSLPFGSITAFPAGSLGLNFFATSSPSIDGSSTGTWTGSSLTITSVATSHTNDVIVVWVVTRLHKASVTVKSISDSANAVTWQGTARESYDTCSGANNEITGVEWYGIASGRLASDTITVNLSTNPSAASAEEFGISGANTASPFDPAILPQTSSDCTGSSTTPSVPGVATTDAGDLAFAAMGTFTALTETAGTIGGSTASIVGTQVGTGTAGLAVEDFVSTSRLSSASCSFGAATSWWDILCDAVVPASQTVTVSFASTDSAGTVQSTMINGTAVTVPSTSYAAATLASTAGSVPASGYLRVTVTAPSGAQLTVKWGSGAPTDFQAFLQYRTT
jgi:hypothetical protein